MKVSLWIFPIVFVLMGNIVTATADGCSGSDEYYFAEEQPLDDVAYASCSSQDCKDSKSCRVNGNPGTCGTKNGLCACRDANGNPMMKADSVYSEE